MGKTSAATALAIDYTTAIHIVSQAKGGIGKSVSANWIAQYLADAGRKPLCFDADPGNKTFARLEQMDVKPIDLIQDGDINPGLYDAMIEAVMEQAGPSVIDTGSSNFISLWNYIDKNHLFEVLKEVRKTAVIHVPIAAVPDLADTLDGFDRICALSPEYSVVVWLNQRHRKIEAEGKQFIDLDVVQANRQKILGVLVNSAQLYKLHSDAVGKMLDRNWTFDQAMRALPVFDKSRLRQVRSEVFGQLEEIGL